VSDARFDPKATAQLRKVAGSRSREIDAVRAAILDAAPGIREVFKWSSATFRASDDFATVNWRERSAVQLVFHKGARVKDGSTAPMRIPDPKKLIRWLSTDRCLVTLGSGKEVAANRRALQAIVRAWIRQT